MTTHAETTEAGPLRVGVIGFGRLAQKYYTPTLRRLLPGAHFAVADPDLAAREQAARSLHTTSIYSEHVELLENEPLDALLVATPPSSHLQLWHEASALGLPVFMEKPFLLGHELHAIDPDAPGWSRLMVNFNRTFWPQYRQLAAAIRQGKIGEPNSAQLALHVNLAHWNSNNDHRQAPEEGGVLYDLGSQLLSVLRLIIPEQPHRVTAKPSGPRHGQDGLILTFDFASDLQVRCDLAYASASRECVLVGGTQGQLRLDNPNANLWWEPGPQGRQSLARKCADLAQLGYRGLVRDRSMLRFTIAAALEDFFRALRYRRPFSPGFTDAFDIAVWTAAAQQSVAEQRPVTINTHQGAYREARPEAADCVAGH